MRRSAAAVAIASLGLAAGCGSSATPDKANTGSLPQGGEPVKLEPASFTTKIDNPWMPIAPGSRWVYRESPGQRNVVEVLSRTKLVDGVRARVVHDVVTENGKLIEDTFDWFAQDKQGNVWYLGEDTKEYGGGGPPSTKGSWEAGVKNAQAGVVMPAQPKVGQAYRQEYLKGEAEDEARVLSVDEKAQAPSGYYPRTVMTRELTALEPHLTELKFYARGIGNVLTVATSGESSREELVSFRRGRF